jgi:Uncharacterized protein conserved in bacteria (DUF2252)
VFTFGAFVVRRVDETLPGPWEWDVKRLVASLAVAGRDNGSSRDQCERVVHTCARAYRESMSAFAAMRELDVRYAHTAIDEALEASVDPKYAKAGRHHWPHSDRWACTLDYAKPGLAGHLSIIKQRQGHRSPQRRQHGATFVEGMRRAQFGGRPGPRRRRTSSTRGARDFVGLRRHRRQRGLARPARRVRPSSAVPRPRALRVCPCGPGRRCRTQCPSAAPRRRLVSGRSAAPTRR